MSSAEAESEGADMARVEEAAIAPGAARALVLAGRMGRLAVAGIVPSLTKERGRERGRGERGGGAEREGGVWVQHLGGQFLIMLHH